ncbi:endonuclease III domain-containing protein [candidate division WOR-3 bacterium]|nr:endonuclease III domain-containing protein [candidate division WOR-3 bacterium]
MARPNTNSSYTTFLKVYTKLFRAFGPQHWWPGDTPFEIMVGAILTQNTNWRNASAAIGRIKKTGLMDPARLLAQHHRIPGLIRTSGFYRAKSRYLRAFLRYYVANYRGKVTGFSGKSTDTIRNELLSIHGIGPETADSILLYALARRVFVVDAYTRRIFARHGFINEKMNYAGLQETIEQELPKSTKLYGEYHALLVRAGKEFCRKNEPLCSNCPLGTMLRPAR